MPTAGSMDRRIRIERYNDALEIWEPIAQPEVAAFVQALGDERFEFRIRWRADLDTLKATEPTTRIRYKDLVLDITDVVEFGPRRREVRLTAEARRIASETLASGAKRHTSWPSE
jgi:Phage head-tail joining protein